MTMPALSSNPVFAAQSTFRAIMNAMARPGMVQKIDFAGRPPAPMTKGTAALAQALFDQDTPLWLDQAMTRTPDTANWLRFHVGSPIVDNPVQCHFALIADADALPAFDCFALGSSDYPDRSTTIIVQIDSLTRGPAIELRGPGVDGATLLRATLQPTDLLDRLVANSALFPLGVDLILVAADSIVALPRTTRVTAKGD